MVSDKRLQKVWVRKHHTSYWSILFGDIKKKDQDKKKKKSEERDNESMQVNQGSSDHLQHAWNQDHASGDAQLTQRAREQG
jgi:hypothetical protein